MIRKDSVIKDGTNLMAMANARAMILFGSLRNLRGLKRSSRAYTKDPRETVSVKMAERSMMRIILLERMKAWAIW